MNLNNYQLICSDIDGTLLDENRAISLTTKNVFQSLKDRLPIVLISSRMPQSLRQLQQELTIQDQPLIAYNGSLIIVDKKVLFSQELPFSILGHLKEYVESTNIHLSLYHQDEWVVPTNDYWAKREANNTKVTPKIQPLTTTLSHWGKESKSAHKVMCMGAAQEIEVLYQRLIKEHAHEINAYRSKDTYIEISHINQDKASALELLLMKHYPGVEMENVIAFGDNYNDATLLQKTGLGVAVANAKKKVLELAKEVCKANIDDGVALFLDQLFLN